MTVANLERIYPIKVYKKCRNVGEHLVIGPFSLIFIEIVLGILGVRLIYQCISSMGHTTKRFFQWSGKMGERL